MLAWRLASIGLFCLAWEIAGRVPINPAFPPFSDTVLAFIAMVADGSLPLDQIKLLAPSLEEQEKGVPEVRDLWRDTFGV